MSKKKDKLPVKGLTQNDILSSIDSFFRSSPIKGMVQQMDSIFGNAFSEATFAVETRETSQEFIVLCKLPGVKKEQLTIETFDQYLTIGVKNESQLETIDEGRHFVNSSYSSAESKRTIALPPYLKLHDLSATYRDGLLTITIPKKDKKRINIED